MNESGPLKVLVMGAGALGCVTGGFLANAGHRVTLVGRAGPISVMRERGIRITGIWGEHDVSPASFEAVTTVDAISGGDFDVVLLCVKSYDTVSVLPLLQPLVDETTLVCSYQNGLGNAEQIADAFGWDRCVEARVIYGAVVTEPGVVDVTVMAHKTAIGVYRETPHLGRVKQIAQAMDNAGVPTEYAEDIGAVLWYKVAYNCSLNPLSALLDVPYGALLDSEETRTTMREVVEELYAVAGAIGQSLNPLNAEEYVTLLFEQLIPSTASHFASMREDLLHGRRTEIDALNGAICRLGAEHGIDCPTNIRLTRAIREREAGSN